MKYIASLILFCATLNAAEWFGSYTQHNDNWLWHNEHGWCYHVGPLDDSVLLYTFDLGWLWTSASTYPRLYGTEEKYWLYYAGGSSPQERWFYNYGNQTWQYGTESEGYLPDEINFEYAHSVPMMLDDETEVTDVQFSNQSRNAARITINGTSWEHGYPLDISMVVDLRYEKLTQNSGKVFFEFISMRANALGQTFNWNSPEAVARAIGEPFLKTAEGTYEMSNYQEGVVYTKTTLTNKAVIHSSEPVTAGFYNH